MLCLRKMLIGVLVVCFYAQCNAEDIQSIVHESIVQSEKNAQSYINEARLINESNDKAKYAGYSRPLTVSHTGKQSKSLFIFISMSMPRNSLLALIHDAKAAHGVLVLRGLVNNSFKETISQINSLVKEAGGGGVQINPIWFVRYSIKTVPTVVVLATPDACENTTICNSSLSFDKVSGDISLESSLLQVKSKGQSAAGVAENYLDNLRGSHHD